MASNSAVITSIDGLERRLARLIALGLLMAAPLYAQQNEDSDVYERLGTITSISPSRGILVVDDTAMTIVTQGDGRSKVLDYPSVRPVREIAVARLIPGTKVSVLVSRQVGRETVIEIQRLDPRTNLEY